jgi:predicted O-methyltransferase YrrM
MPEEIWNKVDDYLDKLVVDQDNALLSALKDSEEADLPKINVSPPQGKMLHILARSIFAKRILEMGTLGAYSTIWLARALPEDGELFSLEINQKHAEIARRNLERAKLSEKVRIILGPALESLSTLYKNGSKPFDFVFIDADKPNYPGYLDWAIKLSHTGTMIVVDNVVRKGAIIDSSNMDANAKGVNQMLSNLRSYKNIIATVIQTVGIKGHDGFALIHVTGASL